MSANARAATLPVVAGCLALSLLLGAATAVPGAALPILRASHGLAEGAGTEVVPLYNVGALAAIVVCGLARRRPGAGASRLLLAGFALGAAGMALAPTWPVLLVGALVAGVGFGGLVLVLNTALCRLPGRRPTVMLGLLHAAFGAGAVTGPLTAGAVDGVTVPLLVVAGGSLLTARSLSRVCGVPSRTGAVRRSPGGESDRPLLLVLAALAFCYAGMEAGIGALMSTHLEALGRSTQGAAQLTALFWGGLTAGRLVLPVVTRGLPEPAVVVGSLVGAALALVLTFSAGPAPVGYLCAGLAMSAVFPLVMAAADRLSDGAASGPGALLLVANLVGSAAVPPLLAFATEPARPSSFPSALLVLTLLAATAALAAARRVSRLAAARPAPRTPQKPTEGSFRHDLSTAVDRSDVGALEDPHPARRD
ncbi:MFS transporter [Streptomyces alkaliterrae]|uniref:MFS transporter n=1 Tax=Streptomyces alkaliterrae TaxID=2213162 RepID=A0A5P0YL17_9ACTN|nr:MFS transporter [Streptomyces alkaliterrae]MBB1253297.1 MFS transporter [Streptomyces alkaliterrae]MBB1259579.1 MFS transporter [Streptomyces alkaliterrae]MQS00995.1 MFS transporter [Streptomyces alkaliterrae]